MRTSRWRRLLVVGVLVAGLGPASAGRVGAQAAGTFSGTAVADGVRVNVSIPNYLLISDFVDGGGPSAQAVLDSLGVSRAFASFPYPGEVGVAATGLVSTLTGFSLPSYPLLATSSYPVDVERNIDQPGLHLNAASQETSSIGDARFGETTSGGALEGGGFSHASVTQDVHGTVVATSEARFSLVVGPVAFRGVRAIATVTRDADGTTTRTSSLRVSSLSIGDVELALTAKGLTVAGSPLVPIDAVSGLTSVLTLDATTVRFVPETVTTDSVMSAGLEVRTSQELPGVGHPVNVTYRLGNVFASATSTAFAPDAVPSLPLPTDSLLGTGAESGGGLAPPDLGVPAGTPSGVPTEEITVRRVGDLVHAGSWTIFPILALAGLVLLAGSLGERWQHTRDSRRGVR